MSQESALLNLPFDTLLVLLTFLGPRDLLLLGSTCRILLDIVHSDCLWLSLCRPWNSLVNLQYWRSNLDSATSLFRLLSSFDRLVGSWIAKDQEPWGSLLYITWGDTSLIAYKVSPSDTEELKLRKFFEIIAQSDGSFYLEAFNGNTKNVCHSAIKLPGKLLWTSEDASEFAVKFYDEISSKVHQTGGHESDGRSFLIHLLRRHQGESLHVGQPVASNSGRLEIMETRDRNNRQAGMPSRDELLRHFLDHRLVHEEDHHQSQELGGLSFSQRALQYLIRLSSTSRNNLTLEGSHGEGCDGEHKYNSQLFYNKLVVNEASSGMDLVGLWSGSYGPHGVEIINVTRTHEGIIGTKILGDPNVPCGQVSFKADLSPEVIQVPVQLQQIVDLQLGTDAQQFSIAKLCNGFGRIAGLNFDNPSWVPGHLLVSETGQIAFLWEDINLIVIFHKLNLAEFYESQNQLCAIL